MCPVPPASKRTVFGAHLAKTSTQLDNVPEAISKSTRLFPSVSGWFRESGVGCQRKTQLHIDMVKKEYPPKHFPHDSGCFSQKKTLPTYVPRRLPRQPQEKGLKEVQLWPLIGTFSPIGGQLGPQ